MLNSDEVNWLLQTIEDPENAKRFVHVQYRRGRISYQMMASLLGTGIGQAGLPSKNRFQLQIPLGLNLLLMPVARQRRPTSV